MVTYTNPKIRDIFITGLREAVFNNLNIKDLARCGQVCRLFRTVIDQMREVEKTLVRQYFTVFKAAPALTEKFSQDVTLKVPESNVLFRNNIPFRVHNVPSGFEIYKTSPEGVESLFYQRKYHEYGGSLPNCKKIIVHFPIYPHLVLLVGDNLSYFLLNLESGKESEFEDSLRDSLSNRVDMGGYINARLELRYAQIFKAKAIILCRFWFVVMNDYPSSSRLSMVHGPEPLSLDEPNRYFIATTIFHDRMLRSLLSPFNAIKQQFDKFPWISALEDQGNALTVSLTNKVEVLRLTYNFS